MYVEFHSNTKVLQEALQEVSEVSVDVRDLATTGEIPLRIVCVARGPRLEGFAEAAADDPTVADVECLNAADSRRLYRIITVPDTVSERAYERAVAHDGVYLNSRNTADGWYNKMNFPDRDSFRQFQTDVSEFGMDVQPTVMRDRNFFLTDESFGLTDKQQEMIAEAIKTGYFEVPRRASLSDVAERINVSDQAASERLRRGMKTIAENGVSDYFTDPV